MALTSLLTPVMLGGLLFLWGGERIVTGAFSRALLDALGLALVLLALALRAWRAKRAHQGAFVHRWFAILQGVGVLALIAYAPLSSTATPTGELPLELRAPVAAGILSALWPALLLFSLVTQALLAFALRGMHRAAALERARLRTSLWTGAGIALVLICAIALQFAASRQDVALDLSALHASEPSEGTRKIVASLDAPLEVFAFFPPASDTGAMVGTYFRRLAIASPQLHFSQLDAALDLTLARELRIRANGMVAFRKRQRVETLFLDPDATFARKQLRTLDGQVQGVVLQLARARRTIYFTAGHGEHPVLTGGPLGERTRATALGRLLSDQNFVVRSLSSAEGLGQEVPSDAAAVFILGPNRKFAPEEAASIAAYGRRGGSFFLALDAEPNLSFGELLGPLGLQATPGPVVQERGIANIQPPPSLADRTNIITRNYQRHPVTTSVEGEQLPMLFVGAVGLSALGKPSNETFLAPVLSDVAAWIDLDANFQFGKAAQEERKAWPLVAAIQPAGSAGMRALVIGDSDALTDALIPLLPGNQLFVLDSLRWLVGDESLAGGLQSERDAPLLRSREQDNVWFYGTSFLAPLFILAVGAMVHRSRQARRLP